jgi:hypothetical protein
LEDYLGRATDAEKDEFEEWFGVEQIMQPDRPRSLDPATSHHMGCGCSGRAPFLSLDSSVAAGSQNGTSPTHKHRRHVVSATLFWKHVNGKDPDLPSPTKELLVDAKRMGLVKRFAPWDSYIAPLFDHSPGAMARHPEVTFRLYLAADLAFLADDFLALGWEVYLMKSASVRYCPGGFWRFLPLEEEDVVVTVIDTDRMDEVSHEISRTENMDRMGLGLWRVPGYYNSDLTEEVRYRPILGGHFGAKGGIPVRSLIEAFVWHWRHGSLPQTARIPGIGERPIMFSKWPNYGFDEWFQLAAMYPWLAPGGTLTFIPADARSLLLPADIEYAMWANPNSEAVYF